MPTTPAPMPTQTATVTQTVTSTVTPSTPPAVEAAQISADTAVQVAILGFIATGIIQGVLALIGHRNAVNLMRKERALDLDEKSRSAHLDQRRDAYVRFLAAGREGQRSKTAYDKARDAVQAFETDGSVPDAEKNLELVRGQSKAAAVWQERLADWTTGMNELIVIGAPRVLDAGTAWLGVATRNGESEAAERGLIEFATAARIDVGGDVPGQPGVTDIPPLPEMGEAPAGGAGEPLWSPS